MRLKTGVAPALFAVGLLAAAPPAHAEEEAGAPAGGELRRLALEQLLDGQYHLPLLDDEETPIRFYRGRGSITFGAGATERVHAGLVDDLAAFGDLDGDRIADAAVVVFIDPGGSGTFIHLLAMRDRDGTPVQAGRAFIGDRVRVESLTIRDGRIFVSMVAHGPGDPMCCPSTRMRRAFTLHRRRLLRGRRLLHGRRLLESAQSTWKTSSAAAHHSPSGRSGSGSCMGSVSFHHSCVLGSAAIAAMSAAKSLPTYSK